MLKIAHKLCQIGEQRICQQMSICLSTAVVAPVLSPSVHTAPRCTWVAGARTCSKQCSVVCIQLCIQLCGHNSTAAASCPQSLTCRCSVTLGRQTLHRFPARAPILVHRSTAISRQLARKNVQTRTLPSTLA